MLEEMQLSTNQPSGSAEAATFLAMAAHDLRSPATAVLGLANLLDERWDDLDDWQRRDLVARIARSAGDLATLIDRTLDGASLEARSFSCRIEPFDVGEMIRAVVHSLSMTGQVGRVSIDVPMFLPLGLGDELRHRQILTNLLINAATHGGKDTTIMVGIELDDDLIVRVDDDGPGMTPEQIEDASVPHVGRGTGLGLAICRSLIEAQGGTLCIESIPSVGSTFAYTIPVAR